MDIVKYPVNKGFFTFKHDKCLFVKMKNNCIVFDFNQLWTFDQVNML